jgi:CRP/FNR family transcriptional regulator, cyclic AMP receptor protein
MDTLHIFRHDPNLHSFSAGETIMREGEAGDRMYVIVEGEVDISVASRHLRTLGPGEIFGEMALIDPAPRSATASARGDVKLATVERRQFLFLVQNTPNFALYVMRVMAERLRSDMALLVEPSQTAG